MKVLALASYPVEAAATRYRLAQFVAPLAERGIDLSIRPFLDSKQFADLYRKQAWPRTVAGLAKSALLRLFDVPAARKVDVVLLQREAMMFGPPLIEWLITRLLKRPIVLDLDDATYVRYISPTYGGIGSKLKWFSKTDDLIEWATLVVCGNGAIADYVASKGATTRTIPTVVDTNVFRPAGEKREQRRLVMGWIGTHSTFPYLESIFPVLQKLAQQYSFCLKIVGAGKADVNLPGVEIENLPWQLDREVADFQSIDIGLYPIDARLYSGKWAQGKSGFKAIQYMAVGIPYVATPIGAAAEIGVVGETHYFANTDEEWHVTLERLLTDDEHRSEMGKSGRRHAIEHYGLPAQADKLAGALREAASRKRKS